MYSWETLNSYCQQHPRWFEPLDRRVPTDEHLAVYRAAVPAGWTLRRFGLWFVAEPPPDGGAPAPAQGWKLHVSVRSEDSVSVLRRVVPVLRDARVAFKFLLDPWSVVFTNGKLWPRTSSGKFVTVYPPGEDEFRAVAGALCAALDGATGPYILSDRRCPESSAVYYRYGGFTGMPVLRPDGAANLMITAPDGSLHLDARPPYWTTPPWITTDPFGRPAADGEPVAGTGNGLLSGRFQVRSAVQFSNRGGIYRAEDTSTGRQVIVKEARPHVVLGSGGLDCTQLLRKEFRLLGRLAGSPHFVTPVSLFEEWEHTLLVEETVDGPQLSQLSIAENPLYTLELTPAALAAYHGRMRAYFSQLAEALRDAHAAGVVLGDLSWTNVLVARDTDRITLIDLEGAVETGVDEQPGLFTRGLASPEVAAGGDCGPADDYYTLGAMMFGAIVLTNNMIGYRPDALPAFLAEVSADLGLPSELTDMVVELTGSDAARCAPDPSLVAKKLAALPVADAAAWPRQIPLAEPAAGQLTGGRMARLRREVGRTVAGVVEYVHATATPERSDRLFPADLGVFETNPGNVAFGAAGVLHMLHRVRPDVPADLVGWLLARDLDPDLYPPGLYHGLAGIAWVLAEFGHLEYAGRLLREAGQHPLVYDRPGVLLGAAGYGLACLRLWQATGEREFLDKAGAAARHLAATAVPAEHGVCWPARPDAAAGAAPGPQVPLGYAHGPAGIALFLLYLHRATADPAWLRLGRDALDFELAHGVRVGSKVTAFPAYADEREPVLRSYWDQGTAGVVTALVRYAAVTGDPELHGWVARLVPDLCRKYAVSPQLFHGLAGLGEALLDVAEFTGDAGLLAEAWRLAEGVLLFRIETPEGIVFPGEQAQRESADLATGSAGVGLFLHRLWTATTTSRSNVNFTLDGLLDPRRG